MNQEESLGVIEHYNEFICIIQNYYQVLITSNWTKAEIEAAYRRKGATLTDLDSLWERLTVIDLWALNVSKRRRADRVDLDPARVAATVASLAGAAALPFPRQPVPSSSSLFAPPSPTYMSPVQECRKRARCASAPSKLETALNLL